MTNAPAMRDRSVVRLSVTPSAKYSCSGSQPILAKGSTTIERRGGLKLDRRGLPAVARGVAVEPDGPDRYARTGRAMFLSIWSPRSTNAYSGGRAPGSASSEGRCIAGLGDALPSCGDVDPVAHQVAVGSSIMSPRLNADTEFDAALGWQAGVALGHPSCSSIAQRTASTTLRNSMRTPSPVALRRGRGGLRSPDRSGRPATPQPQPASAPRRRRHRASSPDIGRQDRRQLALDAPFAHQWVDPRSTVHATVGLNSRWREWRRDSEG